MTSFVLRKILAIFAAMCGGPKVSPTRYAINPVLQSSPQVDDCPTNCWRLWLHTTRSPSKQ